MSNLVLREPLKPIVKWSGGKKDELKHILPHIPEDYTTYLEPFIGGGAVYFHLNPEKSVINDVHKELTDFYQSIKNGKSDEIYAFMAQHPNEEETYYKVRGYDNEDMLDNAKRFYYLRKTCFRGMLRYNETIFSQYDNEDNFMFLDPPYDSEFTDYGYCSFGKEEHIKLADCFKKTSIKCLMIIGKTPFIEELYKGYVVSEYDKKYRFKLHSGRVGNEINNKHLIIKNY